MQKSFLLFLILLLSTGHIVADMAVDAGISVGDTIFAPAHPADTLRTNMKCSIDIYYENDDTLGGICTGFKIWSPDGATWQWREEILEIDTAAGYDTTWSIVTIVPGSRQYPHYEVWDNGGLQVTLADIDELDCDTILFAGTRKTHGMYPGPLERQAKINFIVGGVSDNETRHICICSVNVGSAGDFVFSDINGVAFRPNWIPGAEKCFTVKKSPDILNLAKWEESEGGNDHWYAVLADTMTFDEATAYVRQIDQDGLHGHLATITSQEENDFIFALTENLAPPFPYNQFRLGGTCIGAYGEWSWITGEEFVFTNWAEGEPNSRGELTISMWAPTNSDPAKLSKWNNTTPELRLWSIIEWDIPENTPNMVFIRYGPEISIYDAKTLTPQIYWSYYDTSVATQQKYEIEVGTDSNWSIAEMWSTGAVEATDTSILYNGLPLSKRMEYHIRIRVNNGFNWSDCNVILAFSDVK